MLLGLLHLLWMLVFACVRSEDVVVNTPNGALRGRRTSFGGVNINHFLGVPFGQSARFQEAVPAASWSGVRDAKTFPPMCPQLDKSVPLPTSEDCLFLNVYAPEPMDPKVVLPVTVWIHGGGYKTGTASFYNGTALAAKGVVVVTINYRLDVLGFLSTGDVYGCPGNLGLQDQLLALRWVNATIASFHGNSGDVTIFGESAGSSSVSLLRLSPLSRGLFSKVIMESGSALSPWAVAYNTDKTRPGDWALILGNVFGCSENSTTNLVSCLMSIPVEKLLTVSADLTVKNGNNNVFLPVVEQSPGVIPSPPIEMLEQGYGRDLITLRGVNKDEYSFFFIKTPLENFTKSKIESDVERLSQRYFRRDPEGVKAAILKEYCPNIDTATPEQLRDASVQLMTDFDFVAPTVLETNKIVNASREGTASQYLYHYIYRPTNFDRPMWAGVPHASELPLVFGQPFELDLFMAAAFDFKWTTADEIVSKDVMTLWTNFAKYGTPTPQPVGDVTWPPYTTGAERYLQISSTLSGQAHLKAARVDFWTQLWDQRL